VTADKNAAREQAAKTFAIYGQLPSYRAMLDREGVEGPADLAVVGDEDEVAGEVRRYADAGVTDFNAVVYGDSDTRERTMKVLAALRS